MMTSTRIWLLLATLIVSAVAQAGDGATGMEQFRSSPVGRWETVNDNTGKAESIVNIWEEDGVLYGKIEQLLDPDPQYPDPRCVRCPGELKDKPVIGMRVLWGLKRDGTHWSGGKVLDPNNGKSYQCSLTVEDGGRKLKVRGFIGFSVLGRTQYWLRVRGLPSR
jgi:uncharacterized protein (DUF2147 family)